MQMSEGGLYPWRFEGRGSAGSRCFGGQSRGWDNRRASSADLAVMRSSIASGLVATGAIALCFLLSGTRTVIGANEATNSKRPLTVAASIDTVRLIPASTRVDR